MSYLDLTDERNFIIQVQRALRDINYINYEDASIGLTGIYDPSTRYAVMRFQKDMGLAPTGTVDKETWDMISSVQLTTIKDNSVPRAVSLFPKYSGYEILKDSRDGVLYVLQYMLKEIELLDDRMQSVAITGIYDEETRDAIRRLKRRNLLDDNDTIDAETLNRLFDEYEMIMSRSE